MAQHRSRKHGRPGEPHRGCGIESGDGVRGVGRGWCVEVDDGGTTFEQIFDKYGSPNIGAVAVYQPNPEIIWVGTGEGCVRNSVGWGDGIYKSTDGGKTFTNVGLKESHHIDEIITHPTNPNIVWVAAQGHLWGFNAERGIFQDGGWWQDVASPDEWSAG